MNGIEAVGWLGSFAFAICSVPQAVQCWREGHARGLAWGFLALWVIGELLTIVYVWPKRDWPLLFNYGFNLAMLGVILWYKIKPRAQHLVLPQSPGLGALKEIDRADN